MHVTLQNYLPHFTQSVNPPQLSCIDHPAPLHAPVRKLGHIPSVSPKSEPIPSHGPQVCSLQKWLQNGDQLSLKGVIICENIYPPWMNLFFPSIYLDTALRQGTSGLLRVILECGSLSHRAPHTVRAKWGFFTKLHLQKLALMLHIH